MKCTSNAGRTRRIVIIIIIIPKHSKIVEEITKISSRGSSLACARGAVTTPADRSGSASTGSAAERRRIECGETRARGRRAEPPSS